MNRPNISLFLPLLLLISVMPAFSLYDNFRNMDFSAEQLDTNEGSSSDGDNGVNDVTAQE